MSDSNATLENLFALLYFIILLTNMGEDVTSD